MDDHSAVETRSGFLADLGNLYVAPAEAFGSLLAKNQFWIPMILIALLLAACTGLWVSKADPVEVVRGQLEQMGFWDKMQPEQRARVLEDAPKGFAVKQLAGVVIGPPVVYVVLAGLFFLIFRFAMDGTLTFRKSLTVVCWGSLAVTAVTLPLAVLMLWLKDDWNVPLTNALSADLALALSKQGTPKFLYSLASSMDLFSFWTIFLYATGFATAAKRKLSWGLVGITIPWAIYVLIKSGLASLF